MRCQSPCPRRRFVRLRGRSDGSRRCRYALSATRTIRTNDRHGVPGTRPANSSDGELYASDQVQSHSASPTAWARHGRWFCTPGRRGSPLPSRLRGPSSPLGHPPDPVPARGDALSRRALTRWARLAGSSAKGGRRRWGCTGLLPSCRGVSRAATSGGPFPLPAGLLVGDVAAGPDLRELGELVRLAGRAGGADGLADVAVRAGQHPGSRRPPHCTPKALGTASGTVADLPSAAPRSLRCPSPTAAPGMREPPDRRASPPVRWSTG